jgi:HEAT repeat protein
MNPKKTSILSCLMILSVFTPGPLWAEGASSFKKDLAVYYKDANDMAAKEKVIQDVLAMKKAPALPKAAIHLRKEGEDALQKSQFQDAAQSLRKAADWAPWDASLYTDLAQAQEKAGLYPEAIQSLNLYLLAAPGAEDRQQVQDRIKKLEDENKRWMADQIEHMDVDSKGNTLAARLVEMGPAAKMEVPFLVKALKNNDVDTRAGAAMLLGQIGPDAAGAMPALVDRLDDPVTTVRAKAADALSKMGPGVVQFMPDLIDSLRDDDANVRISASFALGNIGPGAVKAVPALVKVLKDPDSWVRSNAAYALGKIGPGAKDALPVLEGMSTDIDPKAKKSAAWAVQQINATAP